jgi:antibiotic biosynthesis monooxygenase (ABM) superfamily enzyme
MSEDTPVTTVLKITYQEGCQDECLQWMQETAAIASLFEGFISKGIYVSTDTNREIVNIFIFKNLQSLQSWENSEQRIVQTKKGEPFIESINQKAQLAGLEFMFPAVAAPKRWKMVVMTVSVLFILINSIAPGLQQFFTMLHLPMLVKSFLGVAVMVNIMTFLVLPFLSRVLGRWLVS